MPPRLTDWSLALAVGVAFGSGILSLVSGRPADWPVFALHGMAGLALLLLLWGKLRRALQRLLDRRRWDRATLFGAGALSGAVRVISNKPNLSAFEASTEDTIVPWRRMVAPGLPPEAGGLLSSEWSQGEGRRRRVYQLTRRGRRELGERRTEWRDFARAVEAVLA